jgi:hypothetical protein
MATIQLNSAGEYEVTSDPTRVHAELSLDLTREPNDPAMLSISFPFASNTVPTVAVKPPSGSSLPLTLPAPPSPSPANPSTAIPGYEVEWDESDANGIRTVSIVIHKLSASAGFEDWVVKIGGIPAAPAGGMTKIMPGNNTTVTRVESDPIFGPLSVTPPVPFAGQPITLTGTARRNTLPLPTVGSYNPPAPELTWSHSSGPPAAVTVTTNTAIATVNAADGFSGVVTFNLPAGISGTLGYTLTATFNDPTTPGTADDFTASSTITFPVSAVADYWMLLVDRSGTMALGTPVKRTNAIVTAQVWADVICAFRYSSTSTSPDKIGLIDFNDASPGGFRATGPAPVTVTWPTAAAMGPLKAIDDPSQDKFKVAGNSVLGVPQDQTPLGDALIKALDVMAATSGGNQTFRYHMLVVTDGIENTGTVKVDAASMVGNASLAQTFDLIKSSGSRTIFNYTSTGNTRIYPVASGSSNMTVVNSLGTYGIPAASMPNGVRDLFPNAIGTALFGALGAVKQNVFAQPPFFGSDPDVVATPAAADKYAYFVVPDDERDKLVVLLLWNAASNALELGWRTTATAFQPVAAAAYKEAKRDTHVVATVDLSQLSTNATEWRVSYRNGTAAGSPLQTIDAANVLSGRDLHLRTAIAFDRDVYYNDEPMIITASAHAGPTPLDGAKVVVELEGPALSEGELLASNSHLGMPPKDIAVPDGLHPVSREAFLGRVLASKKLTAFPQVGYECPFPGGNELRPDRDLAPGFYSNAFTKNFREGMYNFKVTITGKTPTGGVFSDVHSASRLVKIRPEDAFSDVAITEGLDGPTPGLRSARIRVTPRDALGQRLGPLRAGEVEFQTTRGAFLDQVESAFDGSYSQILVYPEKHVPLVTVQVQGRSFTPVVVSGGLAGIVTRIVRRVQAWFVRLARHR